MTGYMLDILDVSKFSDENLIDIRYGVEIIFSKYTRKADDLLVSWPKNFIKKELLPDFWKGYDAWTLYVKPISVKYERFLERAEKRNIKFN